jgi:hypothetical protein
MKHNNVAKNCDISACIVKEHNWKRQSYRSFEYHQRHRWAREISTTMVFVRTLSLLPR